MDEVGKIAYEAYRNEVHGRSTVTGNVLPPWDELDEALKEQWNRVAEPAPAA